MVRLRHEWRNVKIGYRSHRLEVIGSQFRLYGHGKPIWACVVRCDCGTCKIVNVKDIARGFQKSCGCHRVEVGRQLSATYGTTHGLTGSRLYVTWKNIKSRCNDPKQESYAYYGARGIQVCEEWQSSFVTFAEWAAAHGYRDDLQIDRRDTNGHYEPGNCRFVTSRENNNNRRNTPVVEAFGEQKSLAEWARDRRCAISYTQLWSRLFSARRKMQWTPEQAITTPPLHQSKRKQSVP